MDEKNKVWQKPELIVLVRSKPEEAVLAGCKYLNPKSAAPGADPDAWCCEYGAEGCASECFAKNAS